MLAWLWSQATTLEEVVCVCVCGLFAFVVPNLFYTCGEGNPRMGKEHTIAQPMMRQDMNLVVFQPFRGCRHDAVQKAEAAFSAYVRQHDLPICVEGTVHGGAQCIVHVMQGQEQLGRHRAIIPKLPTEIYVELASYLYGDAPTSHIIKYEGGTVNEGHRITLSTFEAISLVAMSGHCSQRLEASMQSKPHAAQHRAAEVSAPQRIPDQSAERIAQSPVPHQQKVRWCCC